jgi:hypothetical protein
VLRSCDRRLPLGFDSGVINGTVDALARAFRTDAAGTGFAVASPRICLLKDGCDTCNRCIAARETFCISATATK